MTKWSSELVDRVVIRNSCYLRAVIQKFVLWVALFQNRADSHKFAIAIGSVLEHVFRSEEHTSELQSLTNLGGCGSSMRIIE